MIKTDNDMITKRIISAAIIVLVPLFCYFYGKYEYKQGYNEGYNVAYGKGYSEGYADKSKENAVKTETKIVYQKIPYNGNDVQIKTEVPKVKISVNGKTQEIKQKSETADLAVKTETEVKLKIPERRWKIGIGTDGKRPAYMLNVPVKNAVGIWAAGTKGKVMAGVSIGF